MGDIQIALDAIKGKLAECQLYQDYYNGHHKLTFASDRFQTTFGETLKRLRDNLCPIVVDAPADRMEVLNFSGDATNAAVADPAWEIWQRETLELVAHDVHRSALQCGEGFLIVWLDEKGEAKFYPQDSRQCAVIEDEDTGRKQFAAKQWTTNDKKVRLTLYYPDRIEKYITSKSIEGIGEIKESSFVRLNSTGEPYETENPYGVIPMFKFKTEAVLANAIPIQDALNKTFADRLVTQEFGSFRQRWATGIAPPSNEITAINEAPPFKIGVDRLLVTDVDKAKFGDFSATDLEPYLKAADSDRFEMARVTGTPVHFFAIMSDAMSGEALKTMESKFVKKVKRLQLCFGTVWASAMEFALQLENKSGEQNISVQWQSPEMRSEKEMLDAAVIKQELSIPDEVLWEELGYTKEDIAKFKKLAPEEPPVDPAVAQMRAMVNGS